MFECLFAEVSGCEGVGGASDDEVEFDFKLEVADLALDAGGGVVDGGLCQRGRRGSRRAGSGRSFVRR